MRRQMQATKEKQANLQGQSEEIRQGWGFTARRAFPPLFFPLLQRDGPR